MKWCGTVAKTVTLIVSASACELRCVILVSAALDQ